MYTKETYPNLFGIGSWTNYYKNGKLIAMRSEGRLELVNIHEPAYDVLTRAKGYRYWEKHFPDRYCWSLPEMLQEALDMEPASSGYFVDRNGELCGYEG
jgi:hypothetical protein